MNLRNLFPNRLTFVIALDPFSLWHLAREFVPYPRDDFHGFSFFVSPVLAPGSEEAQRLKSHVFSRVLFFAVLFLSYRVFPSAGHSAASFYSSLGLEKGCKSRFAVTAGDKTDLPLRELFIRPLHDIHSTRA